jgi:carbon storage regulator CsrA
MLVLSRKENEAIEFPALGVVIRVFGLTRKRVQLGIDAPISLKVTRGERTSAAKSSSPVESIDSIAEHVIGEEFARLESELAALAELAAVNELPLSRQVAADATERVSRIRRTMTATLRRHEAAVMDELRQTSPRETEWTHAKNQAVAPCVRQSPADYTVCVG